MRLFIYLIVILGSTCSFGQIGLGSSQEINSNDSLVVSEEAYLLQCADIDSNLRKTCTEEALLDNMIEHLVYPKSAKENDIHSFQLTAEFIIDTSGHITQIRILEDAPEYGIKEAKDWLLQCPMWQAAKSNGTAIKTKYTIPIYFNDQW